MKDVGIFFPVVMRRNARSTIRRVESDTESGYQRPTANVKLTASLVGKNDTAGAEHVRLDVHLSPCSSRVGNETEIELVGPSRVGESSTSLFEERDLVVEANSSDERDY